MHEKKTKEIRNKCQIGPVYIDCDTLRFQKENAVRYGRSKRFRSRKAKLLIGRLYVMSISV